MRVSDWDHENSMALTGLQEGDVEPLITLLEDTERPIHAEVRRWLAAMLRGDDQTRPYWWLECKRHPGFRAPWAVELLLRNITIGHRIHKLWDEGLSVSKAKDKIAEELELSSRTIDDAWGDYRDLYFRLKDESSPLSPDLRPLRGQLAGRGSRS